MSLASIVDQLFSNWKIWAMFAARGWLVRRYPMRLKLYYTYMSSILASLGKDDK